MAEARAALNAAAARFGFSETPRLDAELLLAHALGITRERLLLTLGDQPVPPGFADLVERRAAHEPIAYITGTRAFWTIDLAVAPGVLIPRPDSETLIEAAVDFFAGTSGPGTILDLGTGSGALLLAALQSTAGLDGGASTYQNANSAMVLPAAMAATSKLFGPSEQPLPSISMNSCRLPAGSRSPTFNIVVSS
jgi:release factor glutamine methyltransferase